MSYKAVTAAIAAELAAIVGDKYVIFNDPDQLEAYSHDEIPGTHYRHMPEAVVRPESTAQIVEIVKLANRELIPLTPRGAGSGLSGGAVPEFGGIVVSCDRMNRVLEIDLANMMVVVEPGVVANEINEQLKGTGLFYAGYPMSMETCYIGGNVAENAGGGKAVKYGVTSRYVLGLEVVTPTGQVVELGGKLLKDVTGYNMIPLLIGSEGTLGFFTKIILRLIPEPKYQVDLLCLFPTGESAIDAVPKIFSGAGVTPTSIEYMDKMSVRETCLYLNESLPYEDCGAMLLVSVDGSEWEQLEREYEQIGRFIQQAGATEVFVADNRSTSERIWRIRRNIAEAFSLANKLQSGEDVVVPPASIPVVVKEFERIAAKYGVMIPNYGHAGDGNLHSRISPPADWTEERWYATLPSILEEAYAAVAAVGGRISGEHGIGNKRRDYMDRTLSAEALDMMRLIKKSFDPNNIMNPGKVFNL